jgi:hypothetical protein
LTQVLPLPLDTEAFPSIRHSRFINPSMVVLSSAPTESPPSPPTAKAVLDALTDLVEGRSKATMAFLPRVSTGSRAQIRFVGAPPPFRAAPSPPPPPLPPPPPVSTRVAGCSSPAWQDAAHPRGRMQLTRVAGCSLVNVRFCRYRFPATDLNSKSTWFGIQ